MTRIPRTALIINQTKHNFHLYFFFFFVHVYVISDFKIMNTFKRWLFFFLKINIIFHHFKKRKIFQLSSCISISNFKIINGVDTLLI